MAYTINSGSTPPLATFQADILKLVEIIQRGQFPAQILTQGTVDQLEAICNPSLTTSIVAT